MFINSKQIEWKDGIFVEHSWRNEYVAVHYPNPYYSSIDSTLFIINSKMNMKQPEKYMKVRRDFHINKIIKVLFYLIKTLKQHCTTKDIYTVYTCTMHNT